MAEELMSIGIQKLWDLLSKEYEQFWGVKDQVTELQTDLNKLKAFMKDAEAKKHKNELVKNCMANVQEIIFDAEDTIETFILKEQLGKNGGIIHIIQERREVALEIERLSKKISKVTGDMVTFGVQQNISKAKDPQPSQQRVEFAFKNESNLVGLEENLKKLVGHLVEEDEFQVVSMTGMGGLGKTTLARQAFNHETVTKKFERLAWVCVSQVFNRKNVWLEILKNFRPNEEKNKISEMTESALQCELFGLLKTSKFLIVFDDIWKEDDWDLIKPIFLHKPGSKVLITSRNGSVAGGEKHTNFKPECLSDQDSWTLFQTIAMPRKDASELNKVDKEMEEIGKQMIKYCGGLPLAVNVLGGLLAKKCTLHDWRRLSENIGSHLVERKIFNDGNNKSVYNVLSLSFEELPSSLKYCFLYLAHFPEDHEINVEDLSYLWAAEGILEYNEAKTIRDVGDSYIEELVKRNMVISERDNITSRFETCHLHDMMREICLSKADEENFLHIVNIHAPTAHTQCRRFVIHNQSRFDVESYIDNSKVRSLVVVGKDRSLWNQLRKNNWKLSSLNFTRLHLLRVLQLTSKDIFISRELPYSIGELIHLRYLKLEGVAVLHLPSSLRNLKLLIYLNLKVYHAEAYGISIPMHNFLKEMKELKYLALPLVWHKKTKWELSHLVNLETLVNFSTSDGSLEDLPSMARLRTLVIKLTGETTLETLSTSISGLRHLENLDIDFRGAKGVKEWRTLFESNNLIRLKLRIDIPLLYDQLQFPSCLTSLSLSKSRLEEDPMPILEKFVQLKEVNLGGGSFRGRRMVCSGGGFPQLQQLSFCYLDNWEEWIIEEGSMPLLHTLKFDLCKNLKELPDGIRFISSLKNLSVEFMGDEWEKRLLEGGEDYHKVKHIPFVVSY